MMEIASSEARVAVCRRLLAAVASAHLQPEANALYLWGSVLSTEFDEEQSDIDVLLLSADLNREAVAAMGEAARAVHPLFSRLDVTIAPSSSQVSFRVKPLDRIDPVVVFSQIPNLPHVWGDLTLADVVSCVPSSAEVLCLRLRSLRRRLRLHDRNALDEPLCFIVKEMGFICHLLHEASVGSHSFSYEALRRHASAGTRRAVELLMQCRHRLGPCVDRDAVFSVAMALQRVAEGLQS